MKFFKDKLSINKHVNARPMHEDFNKTITKKKTFMKVIDIKYIKTEN